MPKKRNTLDKWLATKTSPISQADLNDNGIESATSVSVTKAKRQEAGNLFNLVIREHMKL